MWQRCRSFIAAYPLSAWLAYDPQNSDLTQQQKHFNYWLSRASIVVGNAFGRLKCRWRRLSKRNDININNMPRVIAVCYINSTQFV